MHNLFIYKTCLVVLYVQIQPTVQVMMNINDQHIINQLMPTDDHHHTSCVFYCLHDCLAFPDEYQCEISGNIEIYVTVFCVCVFSAHTN